MAAILILKCTEGVGVGDYTKFWHSCKMAACIAKPSISTILRKNRGLWTVYYSHARNSDFFLNLTSAVWPPNSCAWGFPLCVIVLHGELKSSSGWKSSLVPHFFKFNKPTHSPNEKGSTGIFGKISWGESVKQDTKISGKSYFGASNSQISLCVELAKTEQMAKKDYWQQ